MFKNLIKRPIAVSMVLLAVMVLGISAMKLLPVSLAPDVDVPQITVQVSSPNTSARELNESVIAPLRRNLVQVSHLSDIRTETKDGSGIITMMFEYGVDIDYLFIEVNEKIDRSMNTMPKNLERPKVVKASATDIPAFYINVTVKGEDNYKPESDLYPVSPRFVEMSNFASQVIVKRIEQMSEVAMVDVSGLVHPEILIVPDAEKLRMLGITESTLESALNGANVKMGNLVIRDGEYQFNVRFESDVVSKRDIENIYLKIKGRVYQLKELAAIYEHPQKRSGLVLSDGKPAVTLAVIKRSEAKMADLKKHTRTLIRSFERDYPDMEFTVTRDQTELLEYSIDNLIQNIVVGALLACVIIFFFMQDFRSPTLVVITIPTALIVSMLVFYLIGLSINIISLAGMVLGLGMMVDNSIVVIDNITYRWNSGWSLEDATVGGTREVFAPMVSSVLTTCAVFVPMIFLSGITGALFYDQAMAVTVTLFSSLLVSVMVIPVFYYLFYKKKQRFEPNRFLSRLTGRFDIVELYDKVLKWFFRRQKLMWTIFAVSLVGMAVMFVILEKEKFPPLSHNDSLLSISWNQRISAEENSRRCQEVMAPLDSIILQSTIMAGVQQFVLSHTDETAVTEAVIYVKAASTRDVEKIERSVGRYISEHYPQAVYSTKVSGNLFDMIFADKDAALAAHLRPTGGRVPDPAQLNELLGRITRSLPDADIQPVEWQEHIEYVARPEMMALYGVSYSDLLAFLRGALNDNSVMTIVQGNYSVPVVVGDNKSDVREIIEGSTIRKNGAEIPLDVLMRQSRGRDLKSITAGTQGEYYDLRMELTSRQIPHAMSVIRDIVYEDPRFEVDFSGTYFSNRKMVGEMIVVLIISVLLLYLILASQFESMVQPLIILSELIIDIFGALAVLWIFGASINLMSLIGIVVMCGIVINDSILKVDTINQLRKQGYRMIHAIFEAGRRRLKPIIMTSLTTILAIAPFLVRGDMGSDLQYPLSLALIGGMVIGTLVSVFFIPIAYYEIYRDRK